MRRGVSLVDFDDPEVITITYLPVTTSLLAVNSDITYLSHVYGVDVVKRCEKRTYLPSK